MCLIASLTNAPQKPARPVLIALTMAAALSLSACGASGPRKPTAANDRSTRTVLADRCLDAQSRNEPTPAGCETSRTARNSRTLPGLQDDPVLSPTMPSLGLPGNNAPLLRR